MKRQSGFTLVEIAIVLVVIGLLLGGVLKGQELVLNSQIRNAINEYNNVASARYAYQDRYRQIPGDDLSAGSRWTDVTPGDGNRLIDGPWDTTAAVAGTTEAGIFWHHLRNDGLVAGPRADTVTGTFELPRNAFDGNIGVQEGAFSGPEPIITSVICQDNIPFKAALIIDTRIDDDDGTGGGGDSGSLQANANDPLGTSIPYAETTARYVMCREL